jgi:hypothetical protein
MMMNLTIHHLIQHDSSFDSSRFII